MLRKLAVSAVGAGALALVVGAPASALPTGSWTLTGASTGSTITATSSNLVFSVSGTPVASCTSATATGKVANTSGTWETPPPNSGTPAISPLTVTTSGCATIPPTPSMTFNMTQNGTAALYATGVTTGSPGTTPGQIRGLSVKGTALGGLCTVQIDGPGGANSKTGIVGGTYNNNGTITATGTSNMTIASAGILCSLGGIGVGDPASLSGSFTVSGTAPVITAIP